MKRTKRERRLAEEMFRFALISPLLTSPPEAGQLQEALRELAQLDHQHPTDPHQRIQVSVSTLERWYYKARHSPNPIEALKKSRRSDCGQTRVCDAYFHSVLRKQYDDYTHWSAQLHYDNLVTRAQHDTQLRVPSYSTVARYMKRQGWVKQSKLKRNTDGALKARHRLQAREVRSFEVEYVNGLWHLDFHHCSVAVINTKGEWKTPKALCVIDDRSRMVCHIQWYWEEDARSLVHGFMQALQKRGLPRSLMTDNGSAMTSEAFVQGLRDLSIAHETTLPYSPYQNAKQEIFWSRLEGRLMAMINDQKDLTLNQLNEYTQIWVEHDYHRREHRELKATPLSVFCDGKHVSRACPSTDGLRQAFTQSEVRVQRKSDGTISVQGQRYEVPNAFRHFKSIHVRYAPWDMTTLSMVDPETGAFIQRLLPWNKAAAADGNRRSLTKPVHTPAPIPKTEPPPLLQGMIDQFRESGLPTPYLIMEEDMNA